jgi:N-acetylmuramoyl-L-alanine amidase
VYLALAGGGSAFTVAIDPGHGGTNLGAAGLRPGLYEKQVTLEIARRMQRRLAADRNIRVVLCRDKDVAVPMRARVRCANEAGARLYLSLHANASPEVKRGSQRGFELYVQPASQVEEDAEAAALIANDDASGAWSAHRVRATAVESLAAARRIEWQLSDALGPMLDVLQGLKMPAVLVEVGFIDNEEEGKVLGTEQGWETMAAALAKAVSDLKAREMRGRADPSITAHRARGAPPKKE